MALLLSLWRWPWWSRWPCYPHGFGHGGQDAPCYPLGLPMVANMTLSDSHGFGHGGQHGLVYLPWPWLWWSKPIALGLAMAVKTPPAIPLGLPMVVKMPTAISYPRGFGHGGQDASCYPPGCGHGCQHGLLLSPWVWPRWSRCPLPLLPPWLWSWWSKQDGPCHCHGFGYACQKAARYPIGFAHGGQDAPCYPPGFGHRALASNRRKTT